MVVPKGNESEVSRSSDFKDISNLSTGANTKSKYPATWEMYYGIDTFPTQMFIYKHQLQANPSQWRLPKECQQLSEDVKVEQMSPILISKASQPPVIAKEEDLIWFLDAPVSGNQRL
ncbi:hypothetical protein ACROYT_G006940 [Oculina patagonica]